MKSFAELEKVFNREKNQQVTAERRSRVKKQFHRIRRGHFESNLEGINSFVFTPVQNNDHLSINITVHYGDKKENKRFMFTLFEDGSLSGLVPKECKTPKDDIEKEILRILDISRLEFWHETDVVILPGHDTNEEIETENEETPEKEGGGGNRPERLEFIANQRGAIFGFLGKDGFDGYRISVFQKNTRTVAFIVLENEKYGNAAYLVDNVTPIEIPPEEILTEQKINKIAHAIWDPIAMKAQTRKELREVFGAKRVFHSGNWEDRMQTAFNTRLAA